MAPWDMKGVLEKAASTGNRNLMVTERGAQLRLQQPGGRHALLPGRCAPSAIPVVFDVTH